jgi:hypothetical protein
VLHVDAFERALQALIVRHETLRTTFPSIDGVAYQCVADDSHLQLHWQDFSALPDDARQQRLQQLADEQAHQPFDLERGPLLRACLVKAAEREHYFVLTLHHIVTEGWAMDIFARELGELYEAFVDERESPLAPLPVQYLDYSVWQRQWLESGEGARQLAYWKTAWATSTRCWPCRPTARARRCRATAASCTASTSTRRWSPACMPSTASAA